MIIYHSWADIQKNVSQHTCTPTFIAALFTITKPWNQPSYPLTNEWIKKMWYIYHEVLFSHEEQ
jgi:hypothetical protein